MTEYSNSFSEEFPCNQAGLEKLEATLKQLRQEVQFLRRNTDLALVLINSNLQTSPSIYDEAFKKYQAAEKKHAQLVQLRYNYQQQLQLI